jgi:ABC-type proline/glycine betaine transport system permease subunit
MLYATSPPDFLNQVAVVAVAFYIICSISFSISFSNSQRFAFPVLNSAGSKNTMYVLSLLVVLICFISFDNLHSFSRDFMVNNA